MNLDLRVSRRMTSVQEDTVIRLTPYQKSLLSVNRGRKLALTTKSGDKITALVRDASLTDLLEDDRAAFVSQNMFDSILGISQTPGAVTLGCDPEFIILNAQGSVVPANIWLPHRGGIGNDGPLVELRPAPAEHENAVVNNLRSLIRGLGVMIDDQFGVHMGIRPEAHSCWENYAIGFHIHIGAPRELTTFAAPQARKFIRSFISALDYFVGIPALLLEDTNVRRLGNGTYGKPGDYRVTRATIEYRTPGGFHLRHPQYAAGIMGLALCVSREILGDAREESAGWRSLERCAGFDWVQKKFNLPQRRDIKWALLEPSKQVAVNHLPSMVKQIRDMKHYEEHSTSIRNYFDLVINNKQFSPNILNNW